MNRFSLAAAAVVSLSALTAQDGPNIVLILTDDAGYREFGMQGNDAVATPHIDSIAHGGVRFTQAYAPSPIDAPARAGILTGRHPSRIGFEHEPQVAAPRVGLSERDPTLGELLTDAGYATGFVGKWGVGLWPTQRPHRRGFAEFFGFLGATRSYVPMEAKRLRDSTRLWRNDTAVEETGYLTDRLGEAAADFVARTAKQRFCLVVAFFSPHPPYELRQDKVEKYGADPRARYGMTETLDENVGRILTAIETHGLANRTLVILAGDHGGPIFHGNGELRSGSGSMFEGGLRVPLAMSWVGRIPAGDTFDRPVSTLDVFATAAAAAGAPAGDVDGVDLLPFIRSERPGAPHASLTWRRRTNQMDAIRRDHWKLVRNRGGAMLFDLARDPGEKKDIAASNPDAVRDLTAELDRWSSTMMEPSFGGPTSACRCTLSTGKRHEDGRIEVVAEFTADVIGEELEAGDFTIQGGTVVELRGDGRRFVVLVEPNIGVAQLSITLQALKVRTTYGGPVLESKALTVEL